MSEIAEVKPLLACVPPDEAVWAYQQVRSCCSVALLAGGCLRDTYFGVPWNDVDIFVSPDFQADRLAALLGPKWQLIEKWSATRDTSECPEYVETFGVHMPSIWQADKEGDHPIQIIVWAGDPTPGYVLGTFDFGFCQIAWNGMQTWITDAFEKDAALNTATFLFSGDYPRLPRCQERAARIGARYPSRQWIMPHDMLRPATDEEISF